MINDILDFSKIEAAKIDLESTDFNLRDALESMLKTVALRADNKGLELLCEVAEEVPAVICGDATRLRQVVINLVGNATKFTEHSEVSVRVETETRELNECMLRFTVMDSGIGTPEEKQELIFAAFSQADTSTTRKYGGTRLGLTISKRLVEMMGGRIWVESELGRGSQFHVTALRPSGGNRGNAADDAARAKRAPCRRLDGTGACGETELTDTDTVRICAIANRDPYLKRAAHRIFLAET